MALERGDLIRQFSVTTIDGAPFDYADAWQRQNLLLIALTERPVSDEATLYVAEIASHADAFAGFEARCVVTTDRVPGIDAPAVVIADRWSEIYLVAREARVSDLPTVGEILECLRYVTHECPECQGEAR